MLGVVAASVVALTLWPVCDVNLPQKQHSADPNKLLSQSTQLNSRFSSSNRGRFL